ncbi:hypothetical protein ZOSMA_8G01300 [Zostera marina]|uniref:Uncharacterized protein n=1 Tax=Zostera marina TaxID=29655 RepID=A0A0K9NK26_ZOSMR|nr:hypothetical protein ZOSMA_8G01300 [Zostera marina]
MTVREVFWICVLWFTTVGLFTVLSR